MNEVHTFLPHDHVCDDDDDVKYVKCIVSNVNCVVSGKGGKEQHYTQ